MLDQIVPSPHDAYLLKFHCTVAMSCNLGGVRALTIDTIIALPTVSVPPSKTVKQSQPSIKNLQVSGNSKFASEDGNQSTMVRPQIWSGFSSDFRHAQCIKPERVLSLYGLTIGTGI